MDEFEIFYGKDVRIILDIRGVYHGLIQRAAMSLEARARISDSQNQSREGSYLVVDSIGYLNRDSSLDRTNTMLSAGKGIIRKTNIVGIFEEKAS